MLKRLVLFWVLLGATSWLQAEPYRIAGNYQLHIPPFFWRDHCSDKPMGYGWMLQKHLWRDLGVPAEQVHVDLNSQQGLSELFARMKAGELDVYLAMPTTDNHFVKTHSEPFFNLENAVYSRQGSGWVYKDWYSLVGKRGAWVAPNGLDRRAGDFATFSREMLETTMLESYEDAFARLDRGEIDYVVTYRAIGSAIISNFSYRYIDSAPIEGVSGPAYLAVAKTSELIDKVDVIDKLLIEYRQSGLLSLLLRQSMQLWLANKDRACE
jgi:ABC-type amino acid transport substrate-binding protein